MSYLRFPHVRGDQLVFVTDDDLWTVSADGGVARRLTAGLGDVSLPFLSPDGKWIAYTSREEGQAEIWVMPAEGGPARRLTWLVGTMVVTLGWTADGRVLFGSNHGQPFRHMVHAYTVSPDGGEPMLVNVGPCRHLSCGADGGAVLGRNTTDLGRWKRYRGGTRGVMWIDPTYRIDGGGQSNFVPFLHDIGAGDGRPPANVSTPMWLGNRVYFLSDHEGIGNLYSAAPDGSDLQRHSDHTDYTARFASTDGTRIVYQCGARIWRYTPGEAAATELAIECHSPRTQLNRKFVDAGDNLDTAALHPEGHSVAITTRGKAYTMPLWEEAVRQVGKPQGVRYRHAQWLHDGSALVCVSDDGGEEALEIHPSDPLADPVRLDGIDHARVVSMTVSPTSPHVALTNQRCELILVDTEAKTAKTLLKSEHERIAGFAWSPDGKWIAAGFPASPRTSNIKLVNVETGDIHDVTAPDFIDHSPAWDPEGKFLYFISNRIYDPVYDGMFFELSFPRGSNLFLATLQKDQRSPFEKQPKGLGPDAGKKKDDKEDKDGADKTDGPNDDAEAKDGDGDKKDDKRKDELKPVEIDLDGIADRVIAFPTPESKYEQVLGIKGKVLFTTTPVEGALGNSWASDSPPKGTLKCYSFEDGETKTVANQVGEFSVAADGATLLYRSRNKLRAIKAGEKAPDDGSKGRKGGWLDLGRVRVSIDPMAEWSQMYREAWRLMRDHFWVENMSGVDWESVFPRYHPEKLRPGTRLEFSDLMWEMQGELGTGHAYEIGGDHREVPQAPVGSLGADLRHDPSTDRYIVDRLVKGDSWDSKRWSPLAAPGVNVNPGDTILAINGQRVGGGTSPAMLLTHQAGQRVEVTVGDAAGENPRTVVVQTLNGDTAGRYREWVEANRRAVHDATGGKVGYIHVPDMGANGYSEFHRYFRPEIGRDALIVDVRFNGGGHVSQLLLEKLRRRIVGYDLKRYGGPETYPDMAPVGPIVALTNEYAGSDGDIFSHAFKLWNLGPLVGKRTWGGVIGIWPRHRLADGTITTQPEFSFWFEDVGWSVENYGTDPHHEVEVTPQDHASNHDPQLAKGLELVQQMLAENPPTLPDFGNRPNLAAPTELPPRG